MSGDRLSGLQVIQHDDTKHYKFYRISSKERSSGTASNFTVLFGNDSRFDRVTECHLISASIPNIMNNISADIGNNVFTANASIAGPISVVFVDGYYNTNEVIARLESEINLIIAPSTISITQNAFTNKLVFSVTGEAIQYDNTGLNFTLGITENIPAVASVSAQSLPNLTGTTMIYIHSRDIAQNVTYLGSDGAVNDVNGAFSIPVNVPYGVHQSYSGNENLDRQVYGNAGRSIKGLQIVLRGNGGRELTELNDNFESVITLKLMYHTGTGNT
jgi:hypothetical protein